MQDELSETKEAIWKTTQSIASTSSTIPGMCSTTPASNLPYQLVPTLYYIHCASTATTAPRPLPTRSIASLPLRSLYLTHPDIHTLIVLLLTCDYSPPVTFCWLSYKYVFHCVRLCPCTTPSADNSECFYKHVIMWRQLLIMFRLKPSLGKGRPIVYTNTNS